MNCPPVLAVTDRPDHADAHWRLTRPLARLAESGVQTDICWIDDDEMPLISPAGRLVVLQRVVVRGGSAEAVRRWTQRLRDAGALAVVYECDDDVLSPAYLEYLDACGGMELVRRERILEERQAAEWAMQACDAVTVSTEPLAEVLRRYTDAPVYVIPNAIDVEWFRARLANRAPWAEHLTIGWAGGRRPDADLEPMAIAWRRIARRYPDVRFIVAGWQPDVVYREVENIDQIIRVPWANLDDYPRVMQADIGCCTVAPTAFNRSKSPIKAWEYALAGAITIGTRTLYNGSAALLATTADEWEWHLSGLITHPDRPRIAAAFAQRIERYHSLAEQVHTWSDTYRQIVASRGAIRVSSDQPACSGAVR